MKVSKKLYLLLLYFIEKEKSTHFVTEALSVEKGGPNLVSDFSSLNCWHELDLICHLKLHYDDWHRGDENFSCSSFALIGSSLIPI